MNNDRSNMSNREGARAVACACSQGHSAVVQAEGPTSIVRSRVGRVLLAFALAVLFTATVTAFSQVHPAFADDAAYQKAVEEEVAEEDAFDGSWRPEWDRMDSTVEKDVAEEVEAENEAFDEEYFEEVGVEEEAEEVEAEDEAFDEEYFEEVGVEEEAFEGQEAIEDQFDYDYALDSLLPIAINGVEEEEEQTIDGGFPTDPWHDGSSSLLTPKMDDAATNKVASRGSETPDDCVPAVTLIIGGIDLDIERCYDVTCEGFEPESLDLLWCDKQPECVSYFFDDDDYNGRQSAEGYRCSLWLQIDDEDCGEEAGDGAYCFVVVARDSSGTLVASAPEMVVIDGTGLVSYYYQMNYYYLMDYWVRYYGWQSYYDHIESELDLLKEADDSAAEISYDRTSDSVNGVVDHNESFDAGEQSISEQVNENSNEAEKSDGTKVVYSDDSMLMQDTAQSVKNAEYYTGSETVNRSAYDRNIDAQTVSSSAYNTVYYSAAAGNTIAQTGDAAGAQALALAGLGAAAAAAAGIALAASRRRREE